MTESADREVLSQAIDWLDAGHTVELVTVAKTWGSSPRPPGSLAAVRDDGVLVGSVSGGCIEKQLAESFSGQKTNRMISHRIDDEAAKRFGLACGGNIELVFETLDSADDLRSVLELLDQRKRVRRVTYLSDQSVVLGEADRDDRFFYDGVALGNVFGPGWRLLLIGAGQLSRFTAEFALSLDYEVIVCDPRPEFRAAWSVENTQLIDSSPDDAVLSHATDVTSVVLALTHDPNLDDMALMEALPADTFYVGALGSRRNRENRNKRLAAIGLAPEEIERLHGPVGLSIGSRSSAEIAISILAELIRERSAATSGT